MMSAYTILASGSLLFMPFVILLHLRSFCPVTAYLTISFNCCAAFNEVHTLEDGIFTVFSL